MHRIGPRPMSGSGLEAALDLLTPPFAAAATHDVVPLAGGRFEVSGPRRQPALLVRLKTALARSAVVVRGRVADSALPPVVFAAFSQAGALLPLFVPRLPPGSDGTGSFSVEADVWRIDGPSVAHDAEALAVLTEPGGASAVAPAEAGDLVDALVVDGSLARLIYLATMEKQRIVAVGREVSAGRHVGLARSGALDALGADLGVPRLADEGDDGYRARLAMFSSWRLSTPAGFAAALNGPGDPGDPATGLPSTVGVTARFRVVEQSSPLAIAVRLIDVSGRTPFRQRFQGLLTAGLLLDLDAPAAANLPVTTRQRLDDVRATLHAALTRDGTDDTRYLTRLAASTLARAIQLLDLLTGDASMTLRRAWTEQADPRHELGLGVTLDRIEPARLAAAVAAARAAQDATTAGNPVTLPGGGASVAPGLMAAVLGAKPRDSAADPIGAWLFEAAGMATATAPDPASVYVSPLPSFGLAIEGPATLAPGSSAQFTARLRQDDSTGRHVLVDEAWRRAQPQVGALGSTRDPLDPDDLRGALQALAAANAALPPALSALVSAGLAPAVPGELAGRILEAYDLDLLLAVPVDDDPAGLDPAAPPAQALRDRMTARSDALTAAGFHSVRVLPDPGGGGVLLLAALSVLPGGANRPGEPPPAAYRWYLTPLPAPRLREGTALPGPLSLTRGAGGRATVTAVEPGVALLVCVAYVRRGLADPYEVRVELPGEGVLNLDQYGYVMNLLEHLCPIGIEINTFDLRRRHVSVDGGPPTFLSSRVSRSYTQFYRRRAGGTDRHPEPEPRS